MGWERKKSTVTGLPDEPSLVLWLIAGIVALVISVAALALHVNQRLSLLQHYSLWLVSGMPLLIWFLIFCLRSWAYNRAVDRHEFESDEAQYAQEQWTAWAGRHLAVLHSEVVLPDALTPAQFIQALPGLEQHTHQVRRIPVEKDESYLPSLLGNIRDALNTLPAELSLNITLLTDVDEEDITLQQGFTDYWKKHIEDLPIPPVTVCRSHPFLAVEKRLKLPDLSVEMLFVQLQGGAGYSDALAMLLLTSDDVAHNYQLAHSARLLRPMLLDTSKLNDELALFFSTQTQAMSTQLIAGDRIRWSEDFASLLEAASAQGGRWETTQLHWLEQYAGICGPFSPWIMAAVVSDVVQWKQVDCLMLSAGEGLSFINTVTTGVPANGKE